MPPENLLLSNIANTLDIQVNSKKIAVPGDTDIPLIHRMTGNFSSKNKAVLLPILLQLFLFQHFLSHSVLSNSMNNVMLVKVGTSQ